MRDVEAFHTTHADSLEWAPGYERPKELKKSLLLDGHSDPHHPILKMLIDDALTSIILVSDGAIGSYRAPLEVIKRSIDRTSAIQRGLEKVTYNHEGHEKGSREPVSDLAVVVDELVARYQKCNTHRKRLEVIKDAQVLAVRLRYAPNRSRVHGTREWREAIANDPRDNGTIALDHGISDRTVRRIRNEFGTIRANGRPKRT